jgi:glutamyl-tRNA synthetase
MRRCRALLHAAAAPAPPVRVRFAPSPTGSLHLGGLRTALFNHLFARRHGGAFLLRIEDTDEERRVAGSEEALQRTLAWCGLAPDEGPGAAGGARGPYTQSQRLPLYAAHAARLLGSGHAYRCFCSPARLAALREHQAAQGLPPGYDGACRGLGAGAAAARAAAGEPSVVRLAVPLGAATLLQDAVLGEVRFPHAAVDDQVLLKASGWPTYHLACVVDDHLMGVTHVIRGQEWLPSTPKHLLLYAALGWAPPAFAHLPLLLNADRSKLSKRRGDAAVEDYAAAGFLPEALLGFVATLGWTPPPGLPPTAPLADLAAAFSLGALHRANAVVDRARLEWYNGQHVKAAFREAAGGAGGAGAAAGAEAARAERRMQLIRDGALAAVLPLLEALVGAEGAGEALQRCSDSGSGSGSGADWLQTLMAAQHERVGALTDFGPLLLPFFLRAAPENGGGGGSSSSGSSSSGSGSGSPGVYAAYLASPAPLQALGRVAPPSAAAAAGASPLRALLPLRPALLEVLAQWEALAAARGAGSAGQGAPLAACVKAAAKAAGVAPGKLMLPVRWAVTGLDAGAAFADTLGLLGAGECAARLRVVAGALQQPE